MRIPLLLAAAAVMAPATAAQTTFLSESFETDGNGTRYSVNFEYRQNASNYFLRTDGSDIATQSGVTYAGPDGSFYFAGRNSDTPGPAIKVVTFDPIAASDFSGDSFTGLTLSFQAATQRQGVFDNNTENDNDYLHFDYSTDGGATYTPCFWFESDVPGLQGQFLVDSNFDGVGDGMALSVSDFAEYSCSIPDGAETVQLRVSYKSNEINESAAFDMIELAGNVAGGPGLSGSIAPGTCGAGFPIVRPSETSRCFPQVTGTNNLPFEQRYTLFFVIEGTSGAATGFSRVAKRGEVKPSAFETLSNQFSLRTLGSDPDGGYDLILLVEEGSVPAPTGSAVELDRVPLIKGGAPLRSAEDLSVFPNPVADVATLRFGASQEMEAVLAIYDALGRQVMIAHEGTVSGVVEAQVNTTALPAGLYVARLTTESGVETLRFSVVR